MTSYSWTSGSWPASAKTGPASGQSAATSRPAAIEKYTPCQTTGPIRSRRPAPKYCATNVVRYSPVPRNTPTTDQVAMRPITAPATASREYQVRNRRSTKTWTVKDIWLRISG